jgi:hypothetical protein
MSQGADATSNPAPKLSRLTTPHESLSARARHPDARPTRRSASKLNARRIGRANPLTWAQGSAVAESPGVRSARVWVLHPNPGTGDRDSRDASEARPTPPIQRADESACPPSQHPPLGWTQDSSVRTFRPTPIFLSGSVGRRSPIPGAFPPLREWSGPKRSGSIPYQDVRLEIGRPGW